MRILFLTILLLMSSQLAMAAFNLEIKNEKWVQTNKSFSGLSSYRYKNFSEIVVLISSIEMDLSKVKNESDSKLIEYVLRPKKMYDKFMGISNVKTLEQRIKRANGQTEIIVGQSYLKDSKKFQRQFRVIFNKKNYLNSELNYPLNHKEAVMAQQEFLSMKVYE